jgi:ATP-binding cassette, subfamily B (MDR/TAP), member 1
LVDGVNIKDYDIHHLRASLGVVSQEPTLFNDTIAENIKYNKANVSKEEIVSAANESNFNPERDAIEVVDSPTMKKPKKKAKKDDKDDEDGKKPKRTDGTGFDKNVGVKGSHISGGQKQRVAIARVILRQPHLLLLDEATSALDSANELKVQESLDRMMTGKTSLTIAHRLDTIRNSDSIFVFHNGKVV